MIRAVIEIILRISFFPVILLQRLATLYLQTLLGVTVASYIYWPDEKWLIFPLCIIIAVNFFKFMTDVRDWVFATSESIAFIGKTIRDKNLHLSGDVGARVSGEVGARVSGNVRSN